MAKSIISNEKKCYFCGSPNNLHRHHIFYGRGVRQLSEKFGCWVYLCAYHHNLSNFSVHSNRLADEGLKKYCQSEFETKYRVTREEFIDIFGRSYL